MPEMSARKFPGKIILFGEYTVLEGYRALALPNYSFHGQWQKGEKIDQRLTSWRTYLQKITRHCHWLNNDILEQFAKEIDQGWRFESSIPVGYGVGSSGAFVAAWYHRYITDDPNLLLTQLQARLSMLEAHFHGKSSGLDPLVSLLESAMLVQGETVQSIALESFELPDELSLFDTGYSRSTEPIVEIFRQKKRDVNFTKAVLPALGKAQELAIDAYILGDWEKVEKQMAIISQIQFEHFQEMIPEGLRSSWKSGWDKGEYYKLCGAGGGGFMLRWKSTLT